MHWTGTGTTVHFPGTADPGPPSRMRSRSVAASTRASDCPIRIPAMPPASPVTTAPTRGQLLVVAALVTLTSLATTIVMAQGVGYLETDPGPNTTPYLSDDPWGSMHAPSAGTTGGREPSLARETLVWPKPERPDHAVRERTEDPGSGTRVRPAATPETGSSRRRGGRVGERNNGEGNNGVGNAVVSSDALEPGPSRVGAKRPAIESVLGQSRSRRARSASTHSRTSSSSSGSTPSATIRARMSLTGSPNASPVIRSV